MFNKIGKLSLSTILIGEIMLGWGSALSINSSKSTEFLTNGLIDSLEMRKPTRAFTTAMKSITLALDGFKVIISKTKSKADQQYFTALKQIFSETPPKVNSKDIVDILKSAQDGSSSAKEMLRVALGEQESYDSYKENLKMQIQYLLDDSASEDSDSMSNTKSNDGSTDVSRKAELPSDEDLEDDYSFGQLQEHMFLGVTSYLKNINDLDAKKIVTGTLDRMLACPDCTSEKLLDEIFPLSEYQSSKPFYDELSRKILERK